MSVFWITFRSVTHAQRGEGILRSANVRCSLGRTPRWMEEQGCGYVLRVYCEQIGPVLDLLKGEKVSIRRVYVQHQDGTLEVAEK